MPQQYDSVFITADNTDVFGARIGIPPEARKGRIYLVSSDLDWTFDLSVFGRELARDCGVVRSQADNLQQIEMVQPNFEFDVSQRGDISDILLDINVVTAGTGLAVLVWTW